MSDDQNTATPEEQELALLKERAELMGLKVHPATKLETLRAKIAEAIASGEKVKNEEETPPTQTEQPLAKSVTTQAAKAIDRRSKEQRIRDEVKEKALFLVRVRIYNLNPAKNDLDGEIITVGNRYMQPYSKFIPFGEATDNGYHIPMIMFKELKNRKFQQIIVKKNREGREVITRRMAPEFNIEIMPALTADEIQELGVRQAAAERLGA